jgi:hypothetical protein
MDMEHHNMRTQNSSSRLSYTTASKLWRARKAIARLNAKMDVNPERITRLVTANAMRLTGKPKL